MTVFWSLAAVMVMIALLFILPALFRSRKPGTRGIDRDTLNVEVIRSQLAELDADLQIGRLSQDQYAAARRDLEQELLSDLAGSGPGDSGKTRSGQWAALVLIVAIPLLAAGLYNQLGSREIIPLLAQMQANPPQQHPGSSGRPSVEEMVNQLAERMRSQPDDIKGWTMLARSYVVLKRYDAAVDAYRNILRLGGNSPELLADYADALAMSAGGRFTPETGELLQRALAAQPDNVKALWLAGHWKNQEGDPAAAIEYWQKAAALLPADGEDAAVIGRQIAQAREQLGLPPQAVVQTAAAATESPVEKPAAKAAPTIQVSVSLDPQLAAQVKPDDTVFVFARAAQGPRMPLAIVRKQVRDLPLSVSLDDSLAMSPAMVLSKFSEVSVGARISRSGNAMPQSGDLQGSKSPVAVGKDQTVAITIDSQVP
ncbi:MAG: c-type cytochrome biogenesis protein CcmI [Gammaproteobacteria bacterium]|jgi:cytochrome c-type biogenesis protein CcmH